MMMEHVEIRQLLKAMLHKSFNISQAVQAVEYAKQKGVLKVQISMS